MRAYWVLITVGILNTTCVTSDDTVVTVISGTECGGVYSLGDGDLQVIYHGTRLNECTFTIDTNDATKKICAYFQELNLKSCETTVKFYGYHGKDGERMDFHTFSCETGERTEYCPAFVTKLHITLKHWGPDTTDEVNVKITYEIDNTPTYLIIGSVVLLVVIICVPVVIIIRYKRRRLSTRLHNNNNRPVVLINTLS